MVDARKLCLNPKNLDTIRKHIIRKLSKNNVNNLRWTENESEFVLLVIDDFLNKNPWNKKIMNIGQYIQYVDKKTIDVCFSQIYKKHMEYMKSIAMEKMVAKSTVGEETLEERIQRSSMNMNPTNEVIDKKLDMSDVPKDDSNLDLDKYFDETLKQRNNDDTKIEMVIKKNKEIMEREVCDEDADEKNIIFTEKQQEAGRKEKNVIEKPDSLKSILDDLKKKHKYTKTHIVSVDSRDRNTDAYANPNTFKIDLNTTYKNVYCIELISAIIPKSEYVINSNNNVIYFSENGGSEISATISEGNYTIDELVTEIGTVMTNASAISGSSWTYTASVNSKTNKITITSGNPANLFELYFNGGTEKYSNTERTVYKQYSVGTVIGFTKTDLSGTYTYTGTNQYNLNGETYILLKLDNIGNLSGTETSKNSISGSFTKINLNTTQNDFKYYNNKEEYISKYELSSPIGKLDQLNISFYNYEGSLYSFNGLENSLLFRIKTLSADYD